MPPEGPVRIFVLATRFSRSAADRFVRAYARPNRVDRRPLAEIFPGHTQTKKNRKRGGFPESTLQVRHNLIQYVRRRILVALKVLLGLDSLLDIRDPAPARLAEDRRTLSCSRSCRTFVV